jgi:hypothetical protein
MRTCLFCEGKARTKEHVLASWLTDFLASMTRTTHIEMSVGTERRRQFILRGKGAGITVKHLCESCNNGWMSALETHAKPYLLAMLRGLTIPLDREAQTKLSAWIMKTVMVYEFLSPGRVSYTEVERREFRDTLQPPQGTAVWLGRCDEAGWSSTITRKVRFGRGWPFAEGAVATFALDHLVFQVLSVRMLQGQTHRGNVTFKSTNIPDPWAHRMFQCWPVQPGTPVWPPAQSAAADANEVQLLARRFEAEPAWLPL